MRFSLTSVSETSGEGNVLELFSMRRLSSECHSFTLDNIFLRNLGYYKQDENGLVYNIPPYYCSN